MRDYASLLIEALAKLYNNSTNWSTAQKVIRSFFATNKLQPRPMCEKCRWYCTEHCPLDGKTRWGTPEPNWGCVCFEAREGE